MTPCTNCNDKNLLIACACGCGDIRRAVDYHGKRYSFCNHHATKGERHPQWKGGRNKHSGYWMLWMPWHHRAQRKGYVPEHIIVAERALGRPIYRNEHCHHINGIKDDNRAENIRVIPKGMHSAIHNIHRGQSPESRLKISLSHRNLKASPETRLKMSISQKIRCQMRGGLI